MAKTDKTSFVSHKLACLLEACSRAEEKLENHTASSAEKPDLIPELFEMLNAADDLVELACPSRTAGEFHGLPKSASTRFSRMLFTHSDRPEWDFAAWYGEKVSQMKLFVKTLIGYWEMDATHSTEMPQEDIREGIQSSLEAAKRYAQLVFDEILGGRLEIQEISAEE